MRKKIVAGNWKMNKNFPEALALLEELKTFSKNHTKNCEVFIATPSLYTFSATETLKNTNIKIFTQDISQHLSGAYTGEISTKMIESMGVSGSIIGHSERRLYHNETNELCLKKIKSLLSTHLTPIYCIGETLEERKNDSHFEIIKSQIEEALFSLNDDEIQKVIIAYEPVWAIGTGETATPEQAQEMHSYIRNLISEKYSKNTAENISILYGGSVKPDNAKEIFSQPDIDGGLIGGASLKIEDFSKIIESYN